MFAATYTIFSIFAVLTALFLGYLASHEVDSRWNLKWKWNDSLIERLEKDGFPKDFVWGTATAAHQVEGNCTNNQWYRWEDMGKTRDKSGVAGDHWNKYESDIQLMKQLNTNSYRFSIEWSKIEPEPGVWDESAIKHYGDVIQALHANGIRPMITLFHFTIPLWFADMGGFEKEENIKYFVRFSKRAFAEYSSMVNLWCTINEISVYWMMSYVIGVFPPGKTIYTWERDISRVHANLGLAHVRVYRALKAMSNGENAQIGIVKNMMQFEPKNPNNIIFRFLGSTFNSMWNEPLHFLKTGEFRIPFTNGFSKIHDPSAIDAYDFLGVNYYSRVLLGIPQNGLNLQDLFDENNIVMFDDEIKTEMPYTIYPEGLYRGLLDAHERGFAPIYITENGAPDQNNAYRSLWIERYLYATQKAIEEGVDIRGFYYWSLFDNFEWIEGYHQYFGLYTIERNLRESSKRYSELIQRWQS